MRFKLFVIATLLLVGCTKTIYVPAQCPAPVRIAQPVDYMSQLQTTSTPSQFVKACLMTRLDTQRAYFNCQKQLDVYSAPANPA